MTKTIPEITDEMVDRAVAKARTIKGIPIHHEYRAILTAALTPEPEIQVTEAMLNDGNEAWNQCSKDLDPSSAARNEYLDKIMCAIYRAMVKAAPKGAKDARQADCGENFVHSRDGDHKYGGPRYTSHRRSTDPK